jgi:hypothetical protein
LTVMAKASELPLFMDASPSQVIDDAFRRKTHRRR